MALLHFHKVNILKTGLNLLKPCSAYIHKKSEFSEKMFEDIKKSRSDVDMPIEIKNPYVTEKPQCLLCKHNITPSFKNVRLLSQFVSSFTGRIYGRHITGLCKFKQKQVEAEIKRAQEAGLMGVYVKDPNFLADPDLYDTSKPFRVL